MNKKNTIGRTKIGWDGMGRKRERGTEEKFSSGFAKKVKSLSAFVRFSRVPVSGFLGFLLPFP